MTWATDHTEPGYKPDERYGDVTQRDTGHNTVTCHADMGHVTRRCSIIRYVFVLFVFYLLSIRGPKDQDQREAWHKAYYRFKFVNGWEMDGCSTISQLQNDDLL